MQRSAGPAVLDRGVINLIGSIRDSASGAVDAVVGGASAVEFDVREAAGWDSTVIPPIVLVVVFLILFVVLFRPWAAPLILIGTVILSPDRLGVHCPSRSSSTSSSTITAPVRHHVPGGAGGGLQHLPDGACPGGGA